MQLSALTSALGRFFSELQRRKVIRVAAGYVIASWIILQVALALETSLNLPSWFDTVVVSFMALGFPVAVIVSWLFEFTPEGIKRTVTNRGGAMLKPQTTDWILIGMLVVVASIALFQAVIPRTSDIAPSERTAKIETPALGDKSIAVLPFANLSPDKENEYFADGLTEELLNLLAKIGDLKVISRTSSFAFKGKDTPLPQIAKQLGVRHILEGSVRTDGDGMRVTAQLIDVATDTHLWSETYDRKIENIFAVQEEIANAVASSLALELTMSAGAQTAPTKNMEAYRLFLQAREHWRLRNKNSVLDSIDLYKRAITLDPQFAEAHAGMAASYIVEGSGSMAGFARYGPLARQSAEEALKLKPKLAGAYAVLGALARRELNWESAIQNYTKAVAFDPSDSLVLNGLATTLLQIGEIEQAAQRFSEAERIDPLYGPVRLWKLSIAFVRREDRAGTEIATKLVQSTKEFGLNGYWYLAYFAHAQGDHAKAERHFRLFMDALGKYKSITEPVVQALKAPAARAQAVKAVKAEVTRDPTAEPEVVFLLVGAENEFFSALNARLARGDTSRFSFYLPFVWRLVANDGGATPALKELFRKAGLVDYWKKHGWPDKCRPQGADDFACD